MANDKRRTGRVTPKKGTPDAAPAGRPRRSLAPKRIGPFERPDPDRPIGQVGRRPSAPGRLFVTAAVYFGCGVAAFFLLSGSLRIIIGVVLIGLSLLWLRGALTAYVRQRGG